MLNDCLNIIEKNLNALNEISQYYIIVDVPEEYKGIELNVDVLNTDNTTTTIKMNIIDIIYFTENGTLTIPPRPFLDKLNLYATEKFNNFLLSNFNDSSDVINKEKIINSFSLVINEVNSYIDVYFNTMKESNSYLSNLLNSDDNNKYIFDILKLKKYIKCMILHK